MDIEDIHNYNEENPALGDILSQVSKIDQKIIVNKFAQKLFYSYL